MDLTVLRLVITHFEAELTSLITDLKFVNGNIHKLNFARVSMAIAA